MLELRTFLPRTLFGRSLLIILVPVILLQVILTSVFLDNHFRKMTTRLAEAVAGEVTFLLATRNTTDELLSINTLARENFGMTVSEISEFPHSNEFGKGIWERWVTKYLDQVLKEKLNAPFRLFYHDGSISIFVKTKEAVYVFTFPERRIYTSSSYIFLLWMVISALLLSFIALLFMRNQVRPIRRLAIAAERFGRGQEAPSFKPTGAREVRQAATAFIVMKERLQRQMDQRTAMLAGISHDLRTPLTRLKLSMSMMEDNQDTADMKADINEMERMIKGYLDFVRGGEDEPVERVALAGFIRNALMAHKNLEIELVNHCAEDVFITLRPMAFERALSNLLTNAGRYGEKIRVTASCDDETFILEVEDNGAGIPADKLEEVFKPFYRLDEARGLSTGGVGLGLTIARDIILAHGGLLTLHKSQDMGGVAARIELPL
ncbi:MAG: ATP-binding protein [Pseudobdellovibrionaceae bacterium]